MAKSALQQIYAKLNQNQDALGLAIAAYKRISGSVLFDPIYYSKRFHDVANSGLDPAVHYVIFGAAEGRSTHPLFNCFYYKEQLSANGIRTNNPLKHYLDNGATSELRPNKLFDPKYYVSQTSGEVPNPLEHYITIGAQQGLDPFPLFDTSFYLSRQEDVRNSKINPLLHYLLLGAFEARAPHCLFDAEHYLHALGIQSLPQFDFTGGDAQEVLSKVIDKSLEINADPDNPTRINPILHYLQFGVGEQRDPHPVFSARFYLKNNPDVRDSNLDPLSHYVVEGQRQHRKPHELFDPTFYLENLPKPSEEAEVRPLEHFLLRDKKSSPHPFFDSSFYLRQYPEAAAAGVNPLAHYLKIESLGHRLVPNGWFDGLFYASYDPEIKSTNLSALEHYIAHGSSENRARNYLDRARKTGAQQGYVEGAVNLEKINVERLQKQANVVVVLFGSAAEKDFLKCLYTLSEQDGNLPIQVVIAGSDNDVNSRIAERMGLTCIASDVENESEACNVASQFIHGDILLFVRKNFQVLSGWLVPLVSAVANNPKAGIICSTSLSPLGRILNAGASLSDDASVSYNLVYQDPFGPDLKEPFPIAVAPRGSIAISSTLFRHLKGFDAGIRSALYQDVDLSHRATVYGAENYCQPLSRAVNQSDYGREPNSPLLLQEADADEQVRFRTRWLVNA